MSSVERLSRVTREAPSPSVIQSLLATKPCATYTLISFLLSSLFTQLGSVMVFRRKGLQGRRAMPA